MTLSAEEKATTPYEKPLDWVKGEYMQLALFDFDGTISTRDTTWDFITRTCGRGRTMAGILRLIPVLIAYKQGRITHHEAKGATIRHFFGGWNEDSFADAAGRYARDVVPKIIRREALDRVRWHLDMGHTVAVVTGSMEILITHWCNGMGIDLIATGVGPGDRGIGLTTRNCFKEEKARRIRERYDLEKYDVIHAYGDSEGDCEMMALAHRKYYRRFD